MSPPSISRTFFSFRTEVLYPHPLNSSYLPHLHPPHPTTFLAGNEWRESCWRGKGGWMCWVTSIGLSRSTVLLALCTGRLTYMDNMSLVWVISATLSSSGFWVGSARGASADQRRMMWRFLFSWLPACRVTTSVSLGQRS